MTSSIDVLGGDPMVYHTETEKNCLSLVLTQRIPLDVLQWIIYEAMKFESYIILQADRVEMNAKSLLSMTCLLRIKAGETIRIQAEGSDQEEAVLRLASVLSAYSTNVFYHQAYSHHELEYEHYFN